MRLYRHRTQDMLCGFLLGFDVRRLTFGTLAAAWSVAVIALVLAIFAWRARAMPQVGDFGALDTARRALFDATPTPERVALWTGMVGLWWLGYGRMIAPILRSGALELARDRRQTFAEMAGASRVMSGRVVYAPLISIAVPLILFCLVAVWALLTHLGVAGELLAAILLPLALLCGFVGAFWLIGALLAAPLMGPAAAFEGRDVLEAISRGTSYMYQRPFRFAAHWLLKLLLQLVAAAFAALMLAATWAFVLGGLWLVGQGGMAQQTIQFVTMPGDMMNVDGMPAARAVPAMVQVLSGVFWATVVLAAGWWVVVSCGFDLYRYALLRYEVDGVTFDEIMIPKEFMDAHRHLNAVETAEQAAKSREDAPATPAPATPVPAETAKPTA